MSHPKVSVIIPVYNGERFLRQCLESLRVQTLSEIEIICVDDGSTDLSANILQEFERKDARFQVVRQENGGAGAVRNNGMRHASGDYYSFLDADDFFAPDMLEKAYLAAKENRADIVVFGCDIYENSQQRFAPCNYSIRWDLLPNQRPFAGTEVSKDIFKVFVGWAWDKLFKADFVKENNLWFQEQRTTNDMLFVFSGIVKAQRIAVLEDILVHYRHEAGSLSVTREKSWHCFYDALLALREQLHQWNLYDRFERDYINYCVHFSLWNLNTLKEPSYTLLYNKLRDEWFEALDVVKREKCYFYDSLEYAEYCTIMKYEASWTPTKTHRTKIKYLALRKVVGKGVASVRQKGVEYTTRLLIDKLKAKGREFKWIHL